MALHEPNPTGIGRESGSVTFTLPTGTSPTVTLAVADDSGQSGSASVGAGLRRSKIVRNGGKIRDEDG